MLTEIARELRSVLCRILAADMREHPVLSRVSHKAKSSSVRHLDSRSELRVTHDVSSGPSLAHAEEPVRRVGCPRTFAVGRTKFGSKTERDRICARLVRQGNSLSPLQKGDTCVYAGEACGDTPSLNRTFHCSMTPQRLGASQIRKRVYSAPVTKSRHSSANDNHE